MAKKRFMTLKMFCYGMAKSKENMCNSYYNTTDYERITAKLEYATFDNINENDFALIPLFLF